MRRHATRPQAAEFGRAEMRRWYRKLDLLPGANEQIIPPPNSLDDTVRQVMRDASLAASSNSPFSHSPPPLAQWQAATTTAVPVEMGILKLTEKVGEAAKP